jgi:hypothetical protein
MHGFGLAWHLGTFLTMPPRPAPHIIRWFLRTTGYAGICPPPFGIFILAEHLYSDRLIRHEREHWAQWQRMGTLRFYVTYARGLLRHGYRNHPLEIEARAAEERA